MTDCSSGNLPLIAKQYRTSKTAKSADQCHDISSRNTPNAIHALLSCALQSTLESAGILPHSLTSLFKGFLQRHNTNVQKPGAAFCLYMITSVKGKLVWNLNFLNAEFVRCL
jgi:hypothetical protein